MTEKVRMADIAEKLGISVVSVSKGLAGKDGVSEEMRAKIIKTAKELGYTPFSGHKKAKEAQALTLGVLVADRFFSDNAFYSNLYRMLLLKSAALGCTLLLEIVRPEDETACRLATMLTAGKVDGVIFMGEMNRDYIRAATKGGLPYLFLDFYDGEMECASVLSDNTIGGERLTNYLLKKGKTQIGFVGSITATTSIMDRFLGYQTALLRHQIELKTEWLIADRDENGRFIPLRLPAQLPQAFVCNCDEVAYNLVETLRHAGLRVPQDVAVVGYDDFRFATLCSPALTTYRVNVEEMAAVGLSQILRRIRRKACIHGLIQVRGQLIERDSV